MSLISSPWTYTLAYAGGSSPNDLLVPTPRTSASCGSRVYVVGDAASGTEGSIAQLKLAKPTVLDPASNARAIQHGTLTPVANVNDARLFGAASVACFHLKGIAEDYEVDRNGRAKAKHVSTSYAFVVANGRGLAAVKFEEVDGTGEEATVVGSIEHYLDYAADVSFTPTAVSVLDSYSTGATAYVALVSSTSIDFKIIAVTRLE